MGSLWRRLVFHALCFPSMDKNGTMTVEWSEWRDYHLLHPADNIPEILLYWKRSTVRRRQAGRPPPGSRGLQPLTLSFLADL